MTGGCSQKPTPASQHHCEVAIARWRRMGSSLKFRGREYTFWKGRGGRPSLAVIVGGEPRQLHGSTPSTDARTAAEFGVRVWARYTNIDPVVNSLVRHGSSRCRSIDQPAGPALHPMASDKGTNPETDVVNAAVDNWCRHAGRRRRGSNARWGGLSRHGHRTTLFSPRSNRKRNPWGKSREGDRQVERTEDPAAYR